MTRLLFLMVPSFVLAAMGNGANAADGCSPGTPISVSLTPAAVVTCCGTEYTISLDAYDNDDCNDPPFKDYLSISGWPGPTPVRGLDGHYRATLSRSHAEPGDYSFTVTASDNTTTVYANDPADASASCNVLVGPVVTASGGNTLLLAGCVTEERLLFVEGLCPIQPSWSAVGPVNISDSGQAPDGRFYALVRASEPPSCSASATVTADWGDCSSSVVLTIARSGPYTMTRTTTGIPECYTGNVTYWELMQSLDYFGLPLGTCSLSSSVYGCIRLDRWRLTMSCPIPRDTWVGEILEVDDGCSSLCGLGLTGGDIVPAGTAGPLEFVDTYAILSCNCSEPSFIFDGVCAIKQTYKVGECIVKQQCIHETHNSPNGNCLGFGVHHDISDDLQNCECQ